MKRVYLVGFMGSGKSVIGKRLASLANMPIYDMDTEIVKKMEMTIPEIFETYGEEKFRELETEYLRQYSDEWAIVATGGGVAMKAENRRLMRETGIVFFLNAPFRDIWRRIATDKNRPIVQKSTRQELETLYYRRKPLYLESAHFKVQTAHRSIQEIADYINFQITRMKGCSEKD